MTCSKCGRDKDLSEFSPKQTSSRGKSLGSQARPVHSWCKRCLRKERQNTTMRRRKEGRCHCGRIPRLGKRSCLKCSSYSVGRLKSLNREQFDRLLQAQNNRCLICQTTTPVNCWCLDHDHQSGKIRGVVCHLCNLTIGLAKEDIFRLQRCLAYLRFHKHLIRHDVGTTIAGVYPQGGLFPDQLKKILGRTAEVTHDQ